MKAKSLIVAALVALSLMPSGLNLIAQAQSSHEFNPKKNSLWNPYGLDGVHSSENDEKFLPRNFLHARWGRFQAVAESSNGKVTFAKSEVEGGNLEDYFVVDSHLVEWDIRDSTLNINDVFWEVWSGGPASSKVLSFDVPVDGKKYYLLKKLNFYPHILEIKYPPDQANPTNLIILIHGWNPDGIKDAYAIDPKDPEKRDFFDLSTAIQSKIKADKGDWALAHYRWERDSRTGGKVGDGRYNLEAAGHVNGQEAAEAGHMHGYYLGELLRENQNLRKVHFIAHSAGAWVARSAATYLSECSPEVALQVTLLDPFIPERLAPPETSLNTEKISQLSELPNIVLENYFSDTWDTDKFGGNESTSQTFEGTPGSWINRQTDKGKGVGVLPFGRKPEDYERHAGPIRFYLDSIKGRVFKDHLKDDGWPRSLFSKDKSSGLRLGPYGNLANTQTTSRKQGNSNDLFMVPFNRGSEVTGDSGGECVVFVQKMRSELAIGWGDAANGPKHAREEGFAVNSLPRVGAAFVDPARPGNRYGHTGIVTSVTKEQLNGRDYYRLLIDDSNAGTYGKIRRNVLMWLRIENNGSVVFDPAIQKDSDRFTPYGLGPDNASGPERAIVFIHEKLEDYNRKRSQLAGMYHLDNDSSLDQVMALRRNLVFYLVDRSGSMKGQGGTLDLRDEVRERIFAHAAQQSPNTKVELQFFNSTAGGIADWHPFDAEEQNRFKAHFNLEFNPDGGTRLFDTVYEVTERLRAQGADYNQIQLIIFSDGEDNESSAQGKSKRWQIISPALAELRVANHFVRAYLFTMGYEISAQDATTLKEIGVEVTAVAVEAAKQNLKHLDRVLLKEGTQFNGKLLGKEIRFDTMFGSSLVPLKDLVTYKDNTVLTKDGISKKVDSAHGSIKMNTGESTVTIQLENVSSIQMAE